MLTDCSSPVTQEYLQSVQNLPISAFNWRICPGMCMLPVPVVGDYLQSVGSTAKPHWKQHTEWIKHLKSCSQLGRILNLNSKEFWSGASIKELFFLSLAVLHFQRCSCLNVSWPCTVDLCRAGNNQKALRYSVMLYFKALTCAGSLLNLSDRLLSFLSSLWQIFCHVFL